MEREKDDPSIGRVLWRRRSFGARRLFAGGGYVRFSPGPDIGSIGRSERPLQLLIRQREGTHRTARMGGRWEHCRVEGLPRPRARRDGGR
ncbi:hypothetical protein D3C87_1770500 [compost metagenome]